MLNRTNRTLSATTHRLNLGTRKLAGLASANNNGNLTLHTAHVGDLVVTVRAGFGKYPGSRIEGPPIMAPEASMPAIFAKSGSSSEASWPKPGHSRRNQQGQSVTLAQQTIGPVVDRSVDVSPDASAPGPRRSPGQILSRTSLGRACDRSRLAGRSALMLLDSAGAS